MAFEDPRELLDRAEAQMGSIPHDKLFNDFRYTKLRETWCAAMFGVGYSRFHSPCTVEVNDSKERLDVDFFVRAKDHVWEFQLAEVQELGRHRGAEYKRRAKGIFELTPYRPEMGRMEGASWIAEGVRKKVEKCYARASTLNVLVYANFDANQMDYTGIISACGSDLDVFASVWVFTSLHLCLLASANGIASNKGWGEIRSIETYISKI